MTDRARCGAEPGPVRPPSGEPGLDELLADPIVQQLMRRDRTDEAATRRLLQQIATASPATPDEEGPGPDDPDEMARLLQETARALRDRCERELRDRYPDMSWARCAVLMHLARQQGVKQAVLADSLAIRPITLVRLLDRLEADGFVVRLSVRKDRRARMLVLTTKARPIIEYTCDLIRKTYDDLQLGISKAEAHQLRALLRLIRSNLIRRLDETASRSPP